MKQNNLHSEAPPTLRKLQELLRRSAFGSLSNCLVSRGHSESRRRRMGRIARHCDRNCSILLLRGRRAAKPDILLQLAGLAGLSAKDRLHRRRKRSYTAIAIEWRRAPAPPTVRREPSPVVDSGLAAVRDGCRGGGGRCGIHVVSQCACYCRRVCRGRGGLGDCVESRLVATDSAGR